jgi:Tat protein secretion system quality control protein TatD with DNase activity
VLAPQPSQEETFISLLSHLPDPEPFSARLAKIKTDVVAAKEGGRLVLIGEIGLDAAARVRVRPTHSTGDTGNWSPSNLTPFKTCMSHQTAIARAQLDLAVELRVSVSFHCVAAPGATLDVLQRARTTHGAASFGRINICIHSCGGMSPAFLKQAAKVLPNTYYAPSVSVTARSASAADSVRMVPRERILVESDAADVKDMTRLVWAATLWVAACRGWKVEDDQSPDWHLEEEEEEYDETGRIRTVPEDEVWAVKTLERNWARFMGLMM